MTVLYRVPPRRGPVKLNAMIMLRCSSFSSSLMKALRTSLVLVSAFLPPAVLVLLDPPNQGLAQQRPGIRTFVTPPAGCSVIEPVERESLYSFIRAQVQALSLADVGDRADRGILSATSRPLVDRMAEVLAGLRLERIEDTCASFVISPYIDSRNEKMTTAARLLVLLYDDLGKMTDETLKIALQSTLQRRVGENTQTLPELHNQRQGNLGRIGQVLEISLSLLIDESRTDSQGKPDHMILSQEQKDELMDFLHSQFPELKGGQVGKYSGDFVKQAALVEAFLAGKYKPADR
jgi:hypothetical protein